MIHIMEPNDSYDYKKVRTWLQKSSKPRKMSEIPRHSRHPQKASAKFSLFD